MRSAPRSIISSPASALPAAMEAAAQADGLECVVVKPS